MTSLFQRYMAGLVLVVLLTAILCGPSPALAATILSSAQSFAVLGASTVTNTGLTRPGIIHAGDAMAMLARNNSAAAYGLLAGAQFTGDLTDRDLGGKTLSPGFLFHKSNPCSFSRREPEGRTEKKCDGN